MMSNLPFRNTTLDVRYRIDGGKGLERDTSEGIVEGI